jgi:hypothetical protein
MTIDRYPADASAGVMRVTPAQSNVGGSAAVDRRAGGRSRRATIDEQFLCLHMR